MIKRLASLISTLFTSVLYPFQLKQSSCRVLVDEPKKKRRVTTRMKTVKPKAPTEKRAEL